MVLDRLWVGTRDRLLAIMAPELESRTWPVPEAAVNHALQIYQARTPEIEQLWVKVHEDCFDVHATVRKGIAFESKSTFVVESCDFRSDRQVLILRQIGRTSTRGKNLKARTMLAIVQVLSLVLFIDPAAYLLRKQPGFEISGKLYTIDLSETQISDYVRQQAALLDNLGTSLMIHKVNCEPGRFMVQAMEFSSESADS